jgi:hypothetical protein
MQLYFNIDIFPENLEIKEKKLSEKPFIHPSAFIQGSRIGAWTEIGENTQIIESFFGDYSYDAGNVSIIYSDIGKFCSIASHVRINPGNHPMERVTQHHMTYRRAQFRFKDTDDEDFFNGRRNKKCIIGHDVWIGHAAIIMPGVKIGTGAVIGSGAVVTKDVGEYEIAVGVPAKVIKKRFDDRTKEKLLKIKWWDWDRKTLEERFDDFYNLDLFLKKYYIP